MRDNTVLEIIGEIESLTIGKHLSAVDKILDMRDTLQEIDLSVLHPNRLVINGNNIRHIVLYEKYSIYVNMTNGYTEINTYDIDHRATLYTKRVNNVAYLVSALQNKIENIVEDII